MPSRPIEASKAARVRVEAVVVVPHLGGDEQRRRGRASVAVEGPPDALLVAVDAWRCRCCGSRSRGRCATAASTSASGTCQTPNPSCGMSIVSAPVDSGRCGTEVMASTVCRAARFRRRPSPDGPRSGRAGAGTSVGEATPGGWRCRRGNGLGSGAWRPSPSRRRSRSPRSSSPTVARSPCASPAPARTAASAPSPCMPIRTGTPCTSRSPTRPTPSVATTPGDSYLVQEKLLEVARKSGADAVHPGYGFLAENALVRPGRHRRRADLDRPLPRGHRLPRRQGQGPAHRRAAPTPRWCPAPPTRSSDADEIVAFAKEHGLPVAIKAAFGGGGRGLKVARTIEEIPELFDSATREAVAAFGRGECFVERYLDKPRHVETQCLADTHGNVVVVSTRDCSLQRRHQKLVEEAPAPFLSDEQNAELRPGVQGDPDRGRLHRRRHLRVPRRPGRHHLLPRGQHPPAGRAPGHRGGHRHRPGPRAVPHRQRRGARLRRPRADRPLLRVPDQRRGRRPRASCPPPASSPCSSRRRARASGSTPASSPATSSAARSTRCWPSSSSPAATATRRSSGPAARWPSSSSTACRPCCRSTA